MNLKLPQRLIIFTQPIPYLASATNEGSEVTNEPSLRSRYSKRESSGGATRRGVGASRAMAGRRVAFLDRSATASGVRRSFATGSLRFRSAQWTSAQRTSSTAS